MGSVIGVSERLVGEFGVDFRVCLFCSSLGFWSRRDVVRCEKGMGR